MLARKFRTILLRPLKPFRGRRQADVIAIEMEACLDTMSVDLKDGWAPSDVVKGPFSNRGRTLTAQFVQQAPLSDFR